MIINLTITFQVGQAGGRARKLGRRSAQQMRYRHSAAEWDPCPFAVKLRGKQYARHWRMTNGIIIFLFAVFSSFSIKNVCYDKPQSYVITRSEQTRTGRSWSDWRSFGVYFFVSGEFAVRRFLLNQRKNYKSKGFFLFVFRDSKNNVFQVISYIIRWNKRVRSAYGRLKRLKHCHRFCRVLITV